VDTFLKLWQNNTFGLLFMDTVYICAAAAANDGDVTVAVSLR